MSPEMHKYDVLEHIEKYWMPGLWTLDLLEGSTIIRVSAKMSKNVKQYGPGAWSL